MRYYILTSDGEWHETDSLDEALSIVDRYGSEVVDDNIDDWMDVDE